MQRTQTNVGKLAYIVPLLQISRVLSVKGVCGSVDPPIRRVFDFRMIYAERFPASTARGSVAPGGCGRAATRDTALTGSPRYTLPLTHRLAARACEV